MKTIKLHFTGFWSNFDPNENMFTHILQKRYRIVLDPVTPDFLICSPLGRPYDYMRYDCPRIMFTGEFLAPDFTAVDYFIGFDDIQFGDRCLRFPLFLYSGNGTYPSSLPLSEDQARELLSRKKYFCNYIFGHDTQLGIREAILEELSRYKRVECAGKHRNNMPDGRTYNMHTKLSFMEQCKFSIAAESVRYPGFTSEKIGHAFRTHTIPIYFGDPDIHKDFNPQAFVNCTDREDVERTVAQVMELDQNDELYIHMLCQNRYHTESYEQEMFRKLEAFLFHIFDQDKDFAYRRPRYYRSYYHEAYLKDYSRMVTSMPYRILKKLGL